MRFAAIDVETANADLSSICQVGVAIFQDGAHTDSWSSLVDPEDEFDGFNVSIHGIDEQIVKGAPKWPVVAAELHALLVGSIAACHTPFDRAATAQACEKYCLEHFDCRWLDTARVVRRAWPEKVATTGYGLRNVAKFLGIDFKHHDALEDARAAGEVLCRASAHTGLSIDDWCARVQRPIDHPMLYQSPVMETAKALSLATSRSLRARLLSRAERLRILLPEPGVTWVLPLQKRPH